MDQIRIGRFIAQCRKARGLTQRQLADGLGISDKTVSKWECGNGLPEVSLMLPLCAALGTDFTTAINAQAIVIGLCFANGLSPVTGSYGWLAGSVFAILHYGLVTSVPLTHGGFLLYNGGFTAALICFLFIPVMEMFFRTKEDRKQKTGK